MDTPKTLTDAIRYFADADNAREYLAAKRWPNGVTCPYCGVPEPMFLKTRRIWKCRACRKQFSVKVGTIFEDSAIGLGKWMTAIWLISNCRNGVSSYEIARDLGVTQKSAWFMLHRIREAMQDKSATKLTGEVEVDESFIGGKSRKMHRDKRERVITGPGGKDKAIALGMVERGGKVRTFHVGNRRRHELHAQVRQNVEAGSALFSDELKSYDGLAADYQHAVINHAVEYARGNVHTNTMENFWSLVKRQLHGTYISVEPFHLFRYLDEQAFRFNERHNDDAGRFDLAIRGIVGKRLTYDALTANSEKPPSLA
jgi:transposase-like protein